MAKYTLRRPHKHEANPFYMLIKQSNTVTANGMSWKGAWPNPSHRGTPAGAPASAEYVIWALDAAAFDAKQQRHFEVDTATYSTWVNDFNKPGRVWLAGWRVDKSGWDRSTAANSSSVCWTPGTSSDIWDFLSNQMKDGPQQSDYGFSILSSGDKFAGAAVLTDPMTAPDESAYEVWRLPSSISEATLGYSMSVGTGTVGGASQNFRSHVESLCRELMVQMDLATDGNGNPLFGLSVYRMTRLDYK